MKLSSRFKAIRFFVGLAALVLATGCAPKIYVIDRQTVLEEEAAGHCPSSTRRW